jgi:hypothetical protein
MLTVWSDAGVEGQATSLHHDGQFAAPLGMTVVKGQRTDEKPMNYGRRLAKFGAGYVER